MAAPTGSHTMPVNGCGSGVGTGGPGGAGTITMWVSVATT